ncbi:nuclear transport factor 2 family protein [Bradyrhizobium jicamae]|uniref:YybH family protein n=1 Tax=Bradyrhizobium jicamae TaxID=280332 RepID=UPI001BA60A1D|nr:nuclear transport factor 2 family protein [Bradyrhizobium jicamae]MBR0757461.1 nuclear transport factor 2 family protein [Bradyrhizobium jicamae]
MDVSQAFADLNSKFVETVNAHDAHRWAALFCKDAVLVPAGQPSVSGRDSIEAWGEVATKIWNHLEIQQGRCSADGAVVWEQGTWTGNVNLPDKQTVDISGNFLLIAEREGRALRIKAHTWNVNLTQ